MEYYSAQERMAYTFCLWKSTRKTNVLRRNESVVGNDAYKVILFREKN